jgi:hypothetical protein
VTVLIDDLACRAAVVSDGLRELIAAAELTPVDLPDGPDFDLIAHVALAALQGPSERTIAVLARAESLIGYEANYALLLDLTEDLQNAASHHWDGLLPADRIRALLGPKTRIAWQAMNQFWADVETWSRTRNDVPDAPTPPIRQPDNPRLRAIVATTLRTVSPHRCIGTGHAAIYEQRGPGGLPGYTHIAALS